MTMPIPDTMQAVEIAEPGGPNVLQPVTRPCPQPGPGEVLIKVAAAGVNRPDVLQRQGLYPPPAGASDLPGLEVSGMIAACGDGVTRWQVGDQVCALLPGGGYADYTIADEGLCMGLPQGVSLIDAAGLPEATITVWANVFEDGALQAGETILVHGGTSGIGMSTIAMATARGAEVITTAGSVQKCETLRKLGLKAVFQYNEDDWEEAIKDNTIGGVDVVLDMAGGDFVTKNIACLKPDGRHISIAFLRGARAEFNIMHVMRKRLKITGSTLRARSIEEKARLCRAIEKEIWPLLASGKMHPATDRIFPLHKAAEAHTLMEAGGHTGKILLQPDNA